MRSHKMRTEKPKGEDESQSENSYNEEFDDAEIAKLKKQDREKYISSLLGNKEATERNKLVKTFQKYSREPIVFIKSLNGSLTIRWTTFVGKAFIKNDRVFVPVHIIGQPLNNRSSVVVHKMSLELIKMTKKSLKD